MIGDRVGGACGNVLRTLEEWLYANLLALNESDGPVWLNDGTGHYSAVQTIDYERQHTPAVGDVPGDGMTDIFMADTVRCRVWRGQGNGRFDPGRTLAYR